MGKRQYNPAKHCGATKKQGGGPCLQGKGANTDHTGVGHCWLHGGNTPTHVTAAARQQAQAAADRWLDDPTIGPITNPAERLLRLAGRIEAAVDAVGVRVNRLNEISIETLAGGEQVKAEVQVWDKLIGRLHSVLVDIQRLGIEKQLADQKVKFEDDLAQVLAENIVWARGEFLTRLALDEAGQAAVADIVREMLVRLDVAEKRLAAQEQSPARG